MKKVKSVRRKMANRNSRFKTYLFLSLAVLFCAFGFSSLTLAIEPNEPPIQPQIRYEVVDEPTSQIERICTAIYIKVILQLLENFSKEVKNLKCKTQNAKWPRLSLWEPE